MKKQRKQKGFTLIELLVVVAIIAVVTGIAIPKYLSARTTSMENAGAAVTRSLGTAFTAHQQRWNTFPATADLIGGNCTPSVPPTAAASCNIEDAVAKAVKNGTPIGQYIATYAQTGSGAGFTLNLDPVTGSNAQRHYFMEEGLAIHVNPTAAATATDPLI